MTKRLVSGFFLALTFFAFLFIYCNVSYAYVEAARKILPLAPPTELTNPDLPKRTGMKLGDITLHSALSYGIAFDPNIYLASQDETYDMVNTITTSVGLDIPIQKHKLMVDYEAIENYYTRFSVNDHMDQRVRGLIVLNLTDYRITINDTYRNYTTLPGSLNTSRIKTDTNDVRAGITREGDRFAFNAGYTNSVLHFYSNDHIFGPVTYRDLNYVSHISDISIGYRFLPKTSLILENDYGIADHKSSTVPDYYFEQLLIGLKGDLHKNLTTNFQAGYRYQFYKDSPIMFDETVKTFVCRGGLKYSVTPENVFDLNLERTIDNSTYKDMTYYTANFVGLSFTHAFTPKISGTVYGTYQRNDYPTEATEGIKTATRHDNAYSGGLSLRYDIQKWLSTEFGYEFKKARTNFRTFDYEDNIATLKVTVGF